MKNTNRTRIIAVVLSLLIIIALSATSFAEEPHGGPQMGSMQPGGQQDNFGQGMQPGAPQGKDRSIKQDSSVIPAEEFLTAIFSGLLSSHS